MLGQNTLQIYECTPSNLIEKYQCIPMDFKEEKKRRSEKSTPANLSRSAELQYVKEEELG